MNASSLDLDNAELKDFVFSLDGTVYQLPVSYQNFKALGWEISARNTAGET